MSLLSIRNLSYVYSQGTPFAHKAVDDLSVDIEKGDEAVIFITALSGEIDEKGFVVTDFAKMTK